jgi:hypothetical protein
MVSMTRSIGEETVSMVDGFGSSASG